MASGCKVVAEDVTFGPFRQPLEDKGRAYVRGLKAPLGLKQQVTAGWAVIPTPKGTVGYEGEPARFLLTTVAMDCS